MKRVLVALIVLLFVFGGFFWWRAEQGKVDFDTYKVNYLPLVNNNYMVYYPSTSSANIFHKETIYDYDMEYFEEDPLLNNTFDLLKTIMNTILGNFESITMEEQIHIIGYKNKTISFKTNNLYGSIDLQSGWFHTSDMEPLANSVEGELFKSMKPFSYWSDKWKNEGRLPWFPEHVGR